MVKAITNGRIITPDGVIFGVVVINDGIISAICDSAPAGAEILDAEGCFVSPGFIDMHTHGAGGCDFMDGTVDAYLKAARMHALHGTTLLYPTTLTSTNELLYETFETYRKAVDANKDGAAFGGLHLEGPYFNEAFAGAQDPRYLRNPKPEEYLEILDRCPEIARWSFAPELVGSAPFAAELQKRGIVASIGHTNATFEECDAAFRSGATHMTHFYSCMSTITRRNAYRYAGAIEYGYYQDGMTVELIADGIHVPADLLHLIVKVKGVNRIALVTDSMRAAGMPEGKSVLGGLKDGQEVIVEDGVAKLPDRSAFAGSVATADRLVRTMVKQGGCTLEQAVQMITANPASIMGVKDRKGTIEVGKDADIVIFDEMVDVKETIVNGKRISRC